jgi:ribose transport system permease protein
LTARLNSAQATFGQGYELDAIATVVLGGASLAGGKGGVLGTLFGALLLGTINNGMNLMNISPFYQDLVKGVIILLAVLSEKEE